MGLMQLSVVFLIAILTVISVANECSNNNDCLYKSTACAACDSLCPGPYTYVGCFTDVAPQSIQNATDQSECDSICADKTPFFSFLSQSNVCGCITSLSSPLGDLGLSETDCFNQSVGIPFYWIILADSRCPEGPRCNQSNMCEPCITNPQKECVECATDMHCRNDSSCDATCSNYTCVAGKLNCTKANTTQFCDANVASCVQCIKDQNCRSDRSCDATCSGGVCSGSLDCTLNPARPVCNVSVGVCECESDASCMSDEHCGSKCVLGSCVLGGENCTSSKKRCDAKSGQCFACNEDTDCPAGGFTCSNHSCVECKAFYDCRRKYSDHVPPFVFCNDGVCGECQSDDKCQVDSNCNGTCGVDNSDGIGRTRCINGGMNCTALGALCTTASGTPMCVECRNTEDCRTSAKKFCVSGNCVECRDDVDCNSGLNCDGKCAANGTCIPGKVTCNATAPHCVGSDKCVQCRSGADCIADNRTGLPNCIGYLCVQCALDSACRTDQTCDSQCINYNCSKGKLNCTALGSNFHCDTLHAKCYQCESNADCKNASEPFCSSGKCSQCLQQEDCRSNGDCNATCVEGTCVSSFSNCTASYSQPVCDIPSGNCVQCNIASDCTISRDPIDDFFDSLVVVNSGEDPFTCVNHSCKCANDIPCRSAQDCNASCVSGTCVLGGLDCTEDNTRCDATKGTCYECYNSTDCPNTKPVCKNLVCTQCVDATDCPFNNQACSRTCNQGSCSYSGLNCSAYSAKCSSDTQCDGCSSSADCKTAPLRTCDTTRRVCVQCVDASHCSNTNDKSCNAQCNSGTCTTGTDCTKTGLFCDGKALQCVKCATDDQCANMLQGCDNGSCSISLRSSWKVFVPAGVGVLLLAIVTVILIVRCVKHNRGSKNQVLYDLLQPEDASEVSDRH